jgi:hypothetical protein
MDNKNIGLFTSVGDNSDFLRQVDNACEKASSAIIQRVQELGNTPIPQAQGFYAEAWHAGTFNADAVLNRMGDVAATLPKSNALNSPDIIVRANGEVVGEYSSKYYADAKASINSQKGYGEQGRIIPSDQLNDGHEQIHRQFLKDSVSEKPNRIENAQQLKEVDAHLTDRVKHGDAESQPLNRNESDAGLKSVRRGEAVKIQPQIDASHIVSESLRSGAVAAGITISMTVAPRIYNMLVHYVKRGELPPDALKSIVDGMGSAALEAGLRASVATSLTMSAKAGLFGSAAQSVDPTLIGTLTFLAFEGIKDFRKFQKGNLSGEMFADSMMRKSVAASAGAYGAAIGQAAIPIPIVGAMIGAMVGSIVAQHGYKLVENVTEAYFRTKEFEQLKQINVALSFQWTVFVSDYEAWVKQKTEYQLQKQQLLTRTAVEENVGRDLTRDLYKALEDLDD